MTCWRWLGCLAFLTAVALTGSSLPVFAQGKDDVKLELKAFDEKATPFWQELVTKTDQTLTVAGQTVTQKQTQTFYLSWTPQKMEGGNWVVEQAIIGVKMNIDIGGNKISYDSTDPNQTQQSNPMTDFFNVLKTLKLTLTIDSKTLEVKEVKGRKEFVDKLAATNPQMLNLLNNILSDDAIKQMAQPTWGAVPKSDVKIVKDATWKVEPKLALGAIGTYESKFVYTYDGPAKDKKDVVEIKVKPSLKYIPPSTEKKDSLPFTIRKESTLNSDEKDSSGTVYFNTSKGRVDESKINMKLAGKLIIEVAGLETTVDLVQTQESVVKTLDANPIKSAEPAPKGK
jgi:hypothetical protein